MVAVLAALVGAGSAQAQFSYGFYGRAGPPNYGPGFRPLLSPYLNIIRGRNFGVDYNLGTRVEIQRRENATQFRSEITDLQAREASRGGPFEPGAAERPIESGTTVSFGNSLGYYNNGANYVQQPVQSAGMGRMTPAQMQAQMFSTRRSR
jgi:hypothetical protein